MALSLTEAVALRRLARVYRRILVLAVPAALAGCQDGGDVLAPDSPGAPAETTASDALAFAVTPGRIAFVSYVPPTGADVWTMSPTGGAQTHLTSFSGAELNPVWSPDHKRVAFERWRNNRRDIYLMNADGSNKHWALATAPGYYVTDPSWAPDGKSLLVQIWIQASKSYVGKIDLATKQWMHLAPAGYYALHGETPIYSKEGDWIYYVVGYSLHRFKPNGPDVLLKTYPAKPGNMALSPDGTKIAFSMLAEGTNSEIYVLLLTTKDYWRLTNDSHKDTHPTWSPDGTQLAFVSDRSGKPQIYTMNSSTGGNVHKLTNKTNGAADPSWYR
jgi:TolB protein